MMTGAAMTARIDRRVLRTRVAITGAFRQLILDQGYDAITVDDITRMADVGRSTFYEHYAGLDDLLAQSVSAPLDQLARGSLVRQESAVMKEVLRHFWENRKVAHALLSGAKRAVVERRLAELLEAAIAADWPELRADDKGRKLLALQLAGGQLAAVDAWLAGRLAVSLDVLADRLRKVAHASAGAHRPE